MILMGISSALASAAFGILFNVPFSQLILVGLVGLMGGLTYAILLNGSTIYLALFVASSVITLLSDIMAHRFRIPTITFLICALIPLVPGGGLYYTMLEVINGTLYTALSKGVDTIMQACCIVFGVVLISGLMGMIRRKGKS